jgi:hypothetical protein
VHERSSRVSQKCPVCAGPGSRKYLTCSCNFLRKPVMFISIDNVQVALATRAGASERVGQ